MHFDLWLISSVKDAFKKEKKEFLTYPTYKEVHCEFERKYNFFCEREIKTLFLLLGKLLIARRFRGHTICK